MTNKFFFQKRYPDSTLHNCMCFPETCTRTFEIEQFARKQIETEQKLHFWKAPTYSTVPLTTYWPTNANRLSYPPSVCQLVFLTTFMSKWPTLRKEEQQSLGEHGVMVRAFGLYWGGMRFEHLSAHHCWSLSKTIIPSLVVWSMTKINAFGGEKQKKSNGEQ